MAILLRKNKMKLQARDYVVSLRLRAEQLEQARADALAQKDLSTVQIIDSQLQQVTAKWNEVFAPETAESAA